MLALSSTGEYTDGYLCCRTLMLDESRSASFEFVLLTNLKPCEEPGLVAHACNPSYVRG